METVHLILDSLLKYWVILLSVFTWLWGQKKIYNKRKADREKREILETQEKIKLKEESEKMLKAINGVGHELKLFKEKVVQENIEASFRYNSLDGNIRELKGKLETVLIFLPGNKTGHA